jgi:hypothetical protein
MMSRRISYVVIVVAILLGTLFSQPSQCQSYCTGDVDGNGTPLQSADLQYLTAFVNSGGPPPIPLYQGDLNADCVIDQADIEMFQCYLDFGMSCFPTYPVPTCSGQDTAIGACCEPLGNCFRRSFYNCFNAGGYWLGHGTFCTPLPAECDMNCVHPPTGLVAWYPLDETSGKVAKDIAGKHNAAHSDWPLGSLGAVTFGPGKVRNHFGIVWGARGIVRVYDDPFEDIDGSDFTIDAWIFASATNVVPDPNPRFLRPIVSNMNFT